MQKPWATISEGLYGPALVRWHETESDALACARQCDTLTVVAWQGCLWIKATNGLETVAGSRGRAVKIYATSTRSSCAPIGREIEPILGLQRASNGDSLLPFAMMPEHGQDVTLRGIKLVRIE